MNTFTVKSRFILSAVLYVICFAVFASDVSCQFEPLSENVYVINGSDVDKCPAKRLEHPVTNPVAIVGEAGIILVDPGSSQQVGKLVVDRLRKISVKPVTAIINTHIHGLYWLANHAVKEEFPDVKIYAHQGMIGRIESGEGLFWLDAITGNYHGAKTFIAAPDTSLTGIGSLNLNGIDLKIHQLEHAHTNHDILIEVIKDKILILGGLVVEPEVPSQGVPQDANFKGQIEATKFAIQLEMNTYIPGQGFPQGIELPQRGLRFLQALYSGVERHYLEGLEDFEITDLLKHELSEFKQWYHFDGLGRVIAEIYLQVEQENF